MARVTTKSLVGDWRTTKVTLIARANATLLLEALEVLGFDFGEDRGGGGNVQAEDAVPADERGNQGPAVSDDEDEFEPFPDDPAESSSHTTVESFPAQLPKIHITGQGESSGLRLWNTSLKLVESTYELYRLSKRDPLATVSLDQKMFPDFTRKIVGKRFATRLR